MGVVLNMTNMFFYGHEHTGVLAFTVLFCFMLFILSMDMLKIKLPITYSYVILIIKADTCLNSQGVNHYHYSTLDKLAVHSVYALDSLLTWIKSISLSILH